MDIPQRVEVLEVSPRDGLQNESVPVSTDDKLRLIDRALAAGARRIEVTSFVHPGRVPQMADAEAVCASLPQRGDVAWSALVLNRRGLDRAIATGRLQEVSMVVCASETFGQRNQGQSLAEGIAAGTDVIRAARAAGLRATACLAVAFGCPFEGEVPAERVLAMADELLAAGPDELCLADTIGVGVPGQMLALFGALRARVGPDYPLRVHLHNTRNTGIANAWAAIAAGVSVLDASIGGIGGCPFAPRATGNIATEDLVYMLDRSGIRSGYDLATLIDAAGWLEGVLGKTLPSMLMKAGGFPAGATA